MLCEQQLEIGVYSEFAAYPRNKSSAVFSIETMLQAQVFCLVSRPAAFKRRTMAVFSTDLSQTVEVLLERKNYNSVKDILSTVNPADIAVIFRDQPAQRLLMLFRLLPKETAADVFVEMEPVLQEQLINAFPTKSLLIL